MTNYGSRRRLDAGKVYWSKDSGSQKVTATKEVMEMCFVDADEGEGRRNGMSFEEGGVGRSSAVSKSAVKVRHQGTR